MELDSRIYVAGHAGLVGSAVVRRLEAEGFTNILTAKREQLDLRDQAEVSHWFKANRPEYVFLVAGTVGGILANSTRPAEFIYDNMMIHGTVVHASHLYGVTKLLTRFLVHLPAPGHAADHREQLLTGPLEPINQRYAIARSLASLCQRTVSSTAATSSRRCPPTSTGPTTTSTSPAVTCCRR
jgi:GDP-L-fucose synthase